MQPNGTLSTRVRRVRPLMAAAVAGLAVLALGACSSGSKDADATTTTTLSKAFDKLPATASVNGAILEVTSTPRTGKAGKTSIEVNAVLKGTVAAGTLRFDVTDQPTSATGKPVSTQSVPVAGPGRVRMPKAVPATSAGRWAVTVTFDPDAEGASTFSVSGVPPVADAAPPFPQLVTLVD